MAAMNPKIQRIYNVIDRQVDKSAGYNFAACLFTGHLSLLRCMQLLINLYKKAECVVRLLLKLVKLYDCTSQ